MRAISVCKRHVTAALIMMALAAGAVRADSLPDPTRPDYMSRTARAPAVTPGWRVTAIIISPSRRFAQINGQTVKPGERVDGATVLEITPYAVKLRGRHGVFTAYLLAGDVKRPITEPHGT
ncbi:MAG: hypothetical protein KGJ56_03825 [Gammaproteobacteria bacterium]|nr:hypothetical protein [Gammaproteobacteria bacterium]